MKVHYLYKITRLSDGAYYIGRHSTTSFKNSYMGGGKHITASIKKHGVKLHVKEILHVVETAEELKLLEQKIVNEELLRDPKCLNIALGGEGGFSISREQQSRQSKLNWENPEYRKKVLSKLSDGRLSAPITKALNQPAVKAKLSKASKLNWENPEYRKKLKDAGKYERKSSTRAKMSDIMRERMTNKNHCTNTVWMTDGNINKRIPKNDIFKFENLGFIKGRK